MRVGSSGTVPALVSVVVPIPSMPIYAQAQTDAAAAKPAAAGSALLHSAMPLDEAIVAECIRRNAFSLPMLSLR